MAVLAPKVHLAKHYTSSTVCLSSQEHTCAVPRGTMNMKRRVDQWTATQGTVNPLLSSQSPLNPTHHLTSKLGCLGSFAGRSDSFTVHCVAFVPPKLDPCPRTQAMSPSAEPGRSYAGKKLLLEGGGSIPISWLDTEDLKLSPETMWIMSAGLEAFVTLCHPSLKQESEKTVYARPHWNHWSIWFPTHLQAT